MKKIIVCLSVTFMAGVLFVNIYNSIVDAVSWGSNVPASIDVMRHYYYSTNPGKFFRYFSPANQFLALLVLNSVLEIIKEGEILSRRRVFAFGTDRCFYLFLFLSGQQPADDPAAYKCIETQQRCSQLAANELAEVSYYRG